ncbi:MAG: DMT family transporter [Pseudomonadota bacterium]
MPPAGQRGGALPPNLVGAFWILVSAVTFTAMMTLVKFLGTNYPAAVQSTYRQMAILVVMLPYIVREGRRGLSTPRPCLLIATMAMSTAGLVLSLYSYQALPFAEANALSFSRTLWLVPLAAVILREQITKVRAGAALAGFAGVVVMLNPMEGGLHPGWGQIAAIGAALMAALVIVCMKTLMRDHKLGTVMAWGATVGFGFSLVPALFVWTWPTPVDLGLLAAMGLLGVATQASYVKGVSIGEAAAIVPVDYTRLLMAAGLGWVLFGERPAVATLAGGAIVIAATVILSWHELRAYRAAGAVMVSAD